MVLPFSKMFSRYLLFSSVSLLICLGTLRCVASTLPPDEVDALKQIGKTLGKNWNFSVDPCQNDTNSGWRTPDLDNGYKNYVNCSCSDTNNTICHVTSIILKQQGLNGTLPPELAWLPELQEIDFTRNYLNGTIPKEWGSMRKLTKISIIGNRLSGEIPEELGNISSLTYLTLETNLLFGSLPSSLGKLVNMDSLMLSSNMFTGELPETLGSLTKLIDFRISDNNFTGRIPDFIQNWTQMRRLEIQASGLQGPIPSGISLLEKLTILRISDINGTQSEFPKLNNMTDMERLILRNCNISGNYPAFIGEKLKKLKSLDLSFNKLVGEIPNFNGTLNKLDYLFLSGNSLTGPLPAWILNKEATLNGGSLIDLSYNNFTWNSGEPSCVDGINFFRSSSKETNLRGFAPCEKRNTCSQHWDSSHINCGGDEVIINGTTFDGDTKAGGAASLSSNSDKWGFSSTGEFIEYQNSPYIASNTSTLTMSNTSLYTKARISPLSLTYYGACFLNGHYDVTLYFAEITFTDEKNYSSLGRRIFDVYIQGKLVLKDFNIKDEASGSGKEVIKKFPADVTSNTLEIRFNWAGKGTTTIPIKGTYGSLISAISVERERGNKISSAAVIGIVASVVCVIIGVLYILWWKGCLRGKNTRGEDLRGVDLQTGSFTLKQIKAATNNFDVANKLGEGGFGPVYRGQLSDGTVIAVKQLSSKSRQGNREFVNEIGMISGLQHPNLVKLHGCCIQGDQLLLVYEYMENNNLARALFGPERFQLKLDWPTRVRICVGIARGLAFLHEESILKIVHRDIKATNVLLDRDLNPKISDFGLAKLDEEENTHISTRIAGTIGYMAPEYALWGYLTHKADVYSFGIVVLEIVSGQNNMSYKEKEDCVCLLHWAFVLHQRERLMELMDPKLGSEFNEEEAARILKVALLCASTSPALRPPMSVVVNMLEGQTVVQDVITDPSIQDDDLRFKVIKEHSQQRQSLSLSQTAPRTGSTSTSDYDLYPNNPSQPLTSSSNEKWMDSSSTSTL